MRKRLSQERQQQLNPNRRKAVYHEKWRSVFESRAAKVLNADVNGALGIMIKSTGKRNLVSRLNSGTVTVPRRIRLREIQQTSSVRLTQEHFLD